MLIVQRVVPAVAAPLKAAFSEKFVAQIALNNLVGKILRAVFKVDAVGGLNALDAVDEFYVGIVARIDVDRQTVAVARNARGVRNESEVEARRIVIAHGKFVVGAVLVDEADFFNRITGGEKFAENLNQSAGNGGVANQLAAQNLPAQILVQNRQVTQIFARNRAVSPIGLAVNARKNLVANLENAESVAQNLQLL